MDGTFERLNAALCERLRGHLGRNPLPSARINYTHSELRFRALLPEEASEVEVELIWR
jgi:hypothetical protein